MNEEYIKYLINKWKEAEAISVQLGSICNSTVISIFDKICQPYFYWKNEEK